MEDAELGFSVEIAETLEKRGIYTSMRLRARKPEVARAAEGMLGMGVSGKMISELLTLDIRTVNALREELEASGAITPHKERTLKQLRAVITLGLEGLMERAKAGNISPLEWAILVDKHELLSGGVTARVEHVSQEDKEADAFMGFLRSRRVAGIVSGVGEMLEMGEGAGPGAVMELAAGGSGEGAPEKES